MSKKILAEKQGKIGQFFFAQNRPKWKFYYAKWVWGLHFMKLNFLTYVVKKLSLYSKCTSKKEVLWFFSKGLRFGILLTVTIKLHTLRYPNLLSAILGDFFCVRSLPHQVVRNTLTQFDLWHPSWQLCIDGICKINVCSSYLSNLEVLMLRKYLMNGRGCIFLLHHAQISSFKSSAFYLQPQI